MESERSNIPWPNYVQRNMHPAPFACIGIILGTVGPFILMIHSLLHARTAHEIAELKRSYGFARSLGWTLTGMFAVSLIAHSVLFTINAILRAGWWRRIGRFTTWKQIAMIPAEEREAFEILVKPIFRGPTSFGTYLIEGGWPALLLRHRSTGQLWVLRGKLPAEIEDQGIEIVRV